MCTFLSLLMHILGIYQPNERFSLAHGTLIVGRTPSQNTFQWPEIFPQLSTVFLHVLCCIIRQNETWNINLMEFFACQCIQSVVLVNFFYFKFVVILWWGVNVQQDQNSPFHPIVETYNHTIISPSFKTKTKIHADSFD